MTEKSKLVCSIIAFMFLALFISVPYLPANWVLELYIFLTQKIVMIEMLVLIPFVLYFGYKDKEWGYALFLIICMTGQVMFVHVYADQYQIANSTQVEKMKKTRMYYYPNWNKA